MLNIIPQPRHVLVHEDKRADPSGWDTVKLYLEQKDDRIASLLKKNFGTKNILAMDAAGFRGYGMTLGGRKAQGGLFPGKTAVRGGEEGYYLQITRELAMVYAGSPRGLFYGIRTLLQLLESGEPIPCSDIFDWPDIPLRGMYLDLRQMMPRFENLIRYIGDYAKYKTNALFIEYEDKIPFKARKELAHRELAFTGEQLEEIRKTARENFIEIIPIQQCFGHLEYVLKHERYKALRENPRDTGAICPLHPKTMEVLGELLDEMVERHPEARYINIGCDEVMSLCTCDKCVEKFGGSREKAFLYHVNRLIAHVAGKEKIPVVYHDMMSRFSDEALQSLDRRVVVMIWIYNGTTTTRTVEALTARLRRYGIDVMGAPSVCCHDRRDDQNFPVIQNRLPNIDEWAGLAQRLDIPCVLITNFAVAGSFGCPYGIYEHAFYLAYYAAEKLWNVNADSGSYLERFLRVFHGIKGEAAAAACRGKNIDSYYEIIGGLAGFAERYKEVAEMIDIMQEYEIGAFRVAQVGKYVYRLASFKEDEEGELTALKARYAAALHYFDSARARMEEKLKVFLPDSLAEVYMNSRFFLADYLGANLYGELFSRQSGKDNDQI